jgi:hypothetical protein
MCVLVDWLGGLEEESKSRAEKRAVRGYREGVLVGALVEGVGIVVHARCRGQLGLGFWRSSEQVYLDRCSVGCGRWRGETWRGKRWEECACRAWWSGLTDYPSRFRLKVALISFLFSFLFSPLRFGSQFSDFALPGGGGPGNRTGHLTVISVVFK